MYLGSDVQSRNVKMIDFKCVGEKSFFDFAKENEENHSYSGKHLYAEIPEDDYWYMLEVLPPLRMQGEAFILGECVTANLYYMGLKWKGKCYATLIDAREWSHAVTDFLRMLQDKAKEEEHGA